jgi:sigma-54 dependent transcriptional regulator, acetoin dehydrogenase operon transcriptional activator AcoR
MTKSLDESTALPKYRSSSVPPSNVQQTRFLATPFFSTREERVALAKLRYFEEGIMPTGVITDAVFQSWTRCLRNQKNRQDKIEFQHVSASRSHLALQRNKVLHEAWLSESGALVSALGSASCSAILTDASGVLIGATPSTFSNQKITPIAHRVGVNLSEDSIGTTAPGIVARTGKQASVLGAEHFYESVDSMHCTAAPIRNIHGQLAGILNISSEGAAFKFDPSGVVGLYAASIENRFLIAQSTEHLIVKFQFVPSMIDTPMVAIAGFDLSGKLSWLNLTASKILCIDAVFDLETSYFVEDIFGSGLGYLASLAGKPAHAQRLANGLQIFLTCEIRTQTGVKKPLPLSAETATENKDLVTPSQETISQVANTLRQADANLIKTVLLEANGNISTVAKKLKVSRGLIYRRLKSLETTP